MACSGAAPAPDEPLDGEREAPGGPAAPPPLTAMPAMPAGSDGATRSAGLTALAAELDRAWKALGQQKPKPVHFLSYAVYDRDTVTIMARDGALVVSTAERERRLVVDVRVGEERVDTRRPDRGTHGTPLPLDDDVVALRTVVWHATDRAYREAVDKQREREAQRKKGPVPPSPVFSDAKPVVHLEAPATRQVDRAAWEDRLRTLSGRLRDAGHEGYVSFVAEAGNRWLVSSEGTAVQTGRTAARVYANTDHSAGVTHASTAGALPAPTWCRDQPEPGADRRRQHRRRQPDHRHPFVRRRPR